MVVCLLYSVCALSGTGPCDGPIPHPEGSYRLWCVLDCDQMKSQKPSTPTVNMQVAERRPTKRNDVSFKLLVRKFGIIKAWLRRTVCTMNLSGYAKSPVAWTFNSYTAVHFHLSTVLRSQYSRCQCLSLCAPASWWTFLNSFVSIHVPDSLLFIFRRICKAAAMKRQPRHVCPSVRPSRQGVARLSPERFS
jgi:hypothetical protein